MVAILAGDGDADVVVVVLLLVPSEWCRQNYKGNYYHHHLPTGRRSWTLSRPWVWSAACAGPSRPWCRISCPRRSISGQWTLSDYRLSLSCTLNCGLSRDISGPILSVQFVRKIENSISSSPSAGTWTSLRCVEYNLVIVSKHHDSNLLLATNFYLRMLEISLVGVRLGEVVSMEGVSTVEPLWLLWNIL